MIIKSFTADSVAGALKVIRQEMGGSAIILKTRPCIPAEIALTGNRIEVTACVDEKAIEPKEPKKLIEPVKTVLKNISHKSDSASSGMSSKPIPKKVQDFAAKLEKKLDFILNAQYSAESNADFATRITPVYLNLLDVDIPVEVARHITKAIEDRIGDNDNIEEVAFGVLQEKLSGAIAPEIKIEPGMKVAFVGPSGAGKTSALAKLAARLTVDEKKKVTLASLDNLKVAAYEEIGSYAEMLDIPIENSANLKRKLAGDTILLIDTASLSCHGKEGAVLAKRLMQLKPDIVFLVYSVCSKSRDLIDAMVHFEALRPKYLIAGHCDETRRWGAILTMAEYLEIPLAYTSSSSGGNGKLDLPDATAIARKVMRIEEVPHA